jgi:hypothetical protein
MSAIAEPMKRDAIDEQMFITIYMLKRGPSGGCKMIYHGHIAEVPPPMRSIGCMCQRNEPLNWTRKSESTML